MTVLKRAIIGPTAKHAQWFARAWHLSLHEWDFVSADAAVASRYAGLIVLSSVEDIAERMGVFRSWLANGRDEIRII